MKRIAIAIIFILSFPLYCLAADIEGFRDIKWGDPMSNLGDSRILEDHGDTKFCAKLNENLNIGDIKVNQIVYGFYKNRLLSVFIIFDGLREFDYLKDSLEVKYGKPFKPNEYLEKYFWGSFTGFVTGIGMIEYSEITDKGRVMFESKKLADEKEKEEKDLALKKGAGDF